MGCAADAQRDATLRARGFDAELGALYVLNAHQRTGIGARLLQTVAADLSNGAIAPGALWVLRDTARASAFCARRGAVLVDGA
ncbi:MAG: GNAT family N-acetyltransferase [Geminicoccaceae bacterium]